MAQFKRRGALPQLRNYTGRKSGGPGLFRSRERIPQFGRSSHWPGAPARIWLVAIGLLSLLILGLAAPIWLPVLSWVIPDRYIMAYAPSFVQSLIFQVDVSEQVPTPQSVNSQQINDLLATLAPTPTPTFPPATRDPRTPGYVQPTAVAVAPTATMTPVISVDVDPRAQDLENEADLSTMTYYLRGFDWEQQGYNNCGPASIRVLMSYWGIEFTEAQAAAYLKPNPEDPNVRSDEIEDFIERDAEPYHILTRVNGNFETLRQLILAGYPVMIESGYNPEPNTVGWTSHYLTLFGFNDEGFVAMDTYRRPNWFYAYNELDYYWRQFNRRYLVAYRDDQAAAIASVIGEDMDDETMYNNAVRVARTELSLDRSDPYGWFNLGSSLVRLGDIERAVLAFDQARSIGLEWRFLWYQFEPYEAYLAAGRYEDVIALADDVLRKKASEEAYYYKGLALEAMGEPDKARLQFRYAVNANSNFEAAQEALDRLDDR